jgi:hypothetical protein
MAGEQVSEPGGASAELVDEAGKAAATRPRLNREQLIAWARIEADGWRHVHPDELGALTATAARAQLRAENGLPAETAAEAAAAEVLLAAAADSEGQATAARTLLGNAITSTEVATLLATDGDDDTTTVRESGADA